MHGPRGESRKDLRMGSLCRFRPPAGLTGGPDSRAARQRLLAQLDLPERLSTNALLEVLNALMTREAFQNLYK